MGLAHLRRSRGSLLVSTDLGAIHCFRATAGKCADSDEIGHLFRFMSDSVPMWPDSNRSEATLRFL